MLTRKLFIVVFLWSTAVFFTRCTEQEVEDTTVKTAVKITPKKSNGVVYIPSPLAKEMRRMYDHMKLVNAQLKLGVTVDEALLGGYDKILTSEATTPSDLTPEFYGFAEGWLSEVSVLKQEPTLENYNNVMNACVHCHESFCPGPIPKIKRLRLIP